MKNFGELIHCIPGNIGIGNEKSELFPKLPGNPKGVKLEQNFKRLRKINNFFKNGEFLETGMRSSGKKNSASLVRPQIYV